MTEDDIDTTEPQEATFKGDAAGLRSAAAELVTLREAAPDGEEPTATMEAQDEPPPIDELWYRDPDKPDQPLAEDVPKSLKAASRDLAEYHRAVEQARAAEVSARDPQPVEQPQPAATDSLPAAATEQPAEQPTQVDPAVADRLHYAAAYMQTLADGERARQDELIRLRGTFPEYAAATTVQQIAELARRDPQRHVQYLAANQRAAVIGQELGQIGQLKQATVAQAAQAQQQYERQAYSDWIKAENDKVDAAIPEAEREVLAKEVGAMLKEVGITKDMIDRPEYRMLRSAQGQMFLAQSARLRIAERARAKPKSLSQNLKPVPPVLRPGVAELQERRLDNIDALNARLDRASNVQQGAKIGAALLKEMRRAR